MRENVQIRIARLLKHSGQTLSTAESCTGGQIAHLLTTVSGSSAWYLGGVVSYAISVKEQVLGVSDELIREQGVVSGEVASAMAEGVRKLTGSNWAVATTGLAEGGDGRYPEGTVWMAVSGPTGIFTRKYHCNLGRTGNIRRFATTALRFLAQKIDDFIKD